jgi:hypothetical protein
MVVAEYLECRRLLSSAAPSFSLSVSVTPRTFNFPGQHGVAKVIIRNNGQGHLNYCSVPVELTSDSAGQNVVSQIGVRLLQRSPGGGRSTTVRIPLTILDEPDGVYYVQAKMWGSSLLAQSPTIPVTFKHIVAPISASVVTAPSYAAGKSGPVTVVVHNDSNQPVSTLLNIDIAFSTAPVLDSLHSQDGIASTEQPVMLRPHGSQAIPLTATVPTELPYAATSPPRFYWIAQVEQNVGTSFQSIKQVASAALKVNLKDAKTPLFGPPSVIWVPPHSLDLSAITAADLNGDGNQDLLVLDKEGFIDFLAGNGDGTFKPATPMPLMNPDGTTAAPVAVAVADINGDSKPDLVVGVQGGGVRILYGNGDGTFSVGPFTSAAFDPSSLAVADFNGDGKPDVLLADDNMDIAVAPPGAVRLLLGNGNGTFKPPIEVSPGAVPEAVVAADFNGDGKMDFACTDAANGGVIVRFGNGQGGFSAPVSYDSGGAASSLAVADFNHDGVPDLAVGNVTQNVAALINDGRGQFKLSGPYTVSAAAFQVIVGDFNSDGFADFATFGGLIDNVNLLLGDGQGDFRDGGVVNPGGYWSAYPTAGVVGDFNHDGKPDLAFIILQSGIVGMLGGQNP